MERKHLQMTYKRDPKAFAAALSALDALKDDDGPDPLDLPELPDLPEQGEEHVAQVYGGKPKPRK